MSRSLRERYACAYCGSRIERRGLCETCRRYFDKHRNRQLCRCAPGGYSVALPELRAGDTLTITLRREVEE